jgi:hypothetical protein
VHLVSLTDRGAQVAEEALSDGMTGSRVTEALHARLSLEEILALEGMLLRIRDYLDQEGAPPRRRSGKR